MANSLKQGVAPSTSLEGKVTFDLTHTRVRGREVALPDPIKARVKVLLLRPERW